MAATRDDIDELIIEYHIERATRVAEELIRNLQARKDPRFGSRTLVETLEISLPALEHELRGAAERVNACTS